MLDGWIWEEGDNKNNTVGAGYKAFKVFDQFLNLENTNSWPCLSVYMEGSHWKATY